jgi:hypothetical protein
MPFFPVENHREQRTQSLFLTAFGPFSQSGADANAATRSRRGDRKPSIAVRAKTWGFHVTTRRAGCERERMPNYLVESYLANTPAAVEDARDRASSLTDQGAGVRYVRTTFLPGDETILHVFEAPSLLALQRAAQLAELAHERIVEAVEREVEP